MRILILGGSGILSTDFTRSVIKQGHDVTVVNRGKRKSNIEEQYRHLITDFKNNSIDELRRIIGISRYDVIIDFLSFNVDQINKTMCILKGLFNQYIFISSATVYKSVSESELINEKSEIGNELWSYAYDKYLCECYLVKYAQTENINYTIIRPYVTYGLTRIPFGLIPDENFTLINRMICGKPIVLWDGGRAISTLTNTKDFAAALTKILLNPRAYNESIHITSSEQLTWSSITEIIYSKLNLSKCIIAIPKEYIVEQMPEFKGILCGDKGRNMQFDNSKLLSIIPKFEFNIPFSNGIADTIDYYFDNPHKQIVNYKWDAKIDNMISKYLKQHPKIKIDKSTISIKAYKNKLGIKEKIIYTVYRNDVTLGIIRIIKKIIK